MTKAETLIQIMRMIWNCDDPTEEAFTAFFHDREVARTKRQGVLCMDEDANVQARFFGATAASAIFGEGWFESGIIWQFSDASEVFIATGGGAIALPADIKCFRHPICSLHQGNATLN